MNDANFYRNIHKKMPLASRSEGVHVHTDAGRKLLDFGSGIGVTSIGAGVPQVIERMARQLEQGTFVFNGYFTNEPRIELSRKLLALCPASMGGVIFAGSGSEANEVAIKIARQYHRETGNDSRFKVISRRQSYHGNTMGSLSVSDRASWTDHFRPYLHDFPKISAPYCYRCPLGLSYPSCQVHCAAELEDAIVAAGPQTVSAFIAEPVVGTTVAGVTPPAEYYGTIRAICDKHNVLFIADEVITGLGRTGTNLGLDHWNVPADITTVAKGLAAGYAPLAAVILSKKIVQAIGDGSGFHTQGFTYSGNPLSCAAGLAVLDHIASHNLIKQAAKRGQHLRRRLETLQQINVVGNVRGLGMFQGIEFVRDRATKAPFPAEVRLTQRIVDRAMELGLIVIGGMPGCADGTNGDQLQISPAFVFSEEQIDEAVALLRQAIEDVRAEL